MSKRRKNITEDNISINKFLKVYCGVLDSVFMDNNITHKDLKVLIPDLKRLPFSYIEKNKYLISTGEAVMVADSNGVVIPYETPEPEKDIQNIEMDIEYFKEEVKNIEEAILDENLNTYELSELCKKYKHDGRIKEYRTTYRLLKEKKMANNTKKYHEKKLIYRMKGRLDD